MESKVLTIWLDEEEKVRIWATPLTVRHMRLKLRFELDSFSFNVPDDKDFVISRLCNHIGINGAPTDGCDIFIRKS